MKTNINFSELKNSPVFYAVVITLFIVIVLAFSIYLVLDIFSLRSNIIEVRETYENNCKQIQELQQIYVQYNTLSAEKDVMDRMLPSQRDVYEVMDEVYNECDKYNLTVTEFETPVVTSAYTTEMAISLTVEGTYDDIIMFTEYYSELEQIHRIEQLTLKDSEENEGLKTAQIKIVELSSD